MQTRPTYRFGPFQLDVRERRLSRLGTVIPLRVKVFDTLCLLVEHAGTLVTKQKLLDAVWPETVVEENNVTHTMSVLRKALGEKATGQQYSRPSRAWAIGSRRPSSGLTSPSRSTERRSTFDHGRKSVTA